ncbi:MAG: hypothetical protein WA754_26695, partial [Pseudolabrys sp.]
MTAFGEQLHIALRNGAEQHEFQQFIVVHGIGACLAEAAAQPFAMGVEVGGASRKRRPSRPFCGAFS